MVDSPTKVIDGGRRCGPSPRAPKRRSAGETQKRTGSRGGGEVGRPPGCAMCPSGSRGSPAPVTCEVCGEPLCGAGRRWLRCGREVCGEPLRPQAGTSPGVLGRGSGWVQTSGLAGRWVQTSGLAGRAMRYLGGLKPPQARGARKLPHGGADLARWLGDRGLRGGGRMIEVVGASPAEQSCTGS